MGKQKVRRSAEPKRKVEELEKSRKLVALLLTDSIACASAEKYVQMQLLRDHA